MADFFKEKVFHNTSIKIFSIIFALVFWIYVMDQVNPMITKTFRNIDVELLNVSSVEENKLLIANNQDFFVDVTVEGRRDEILQMENNDFTVTADLIGHQSGMNVIKVNTKSNNNEVTITGQSKDEIRIELEKLVERLKPIHVSYTGGLPDNYRINRSHMPIAEIFVSGPESKVNQVAKLTGTMNLDDKRKEFTGEVPLTPVDEDGDTVTGVDLDQKYVNLTIGIVKQREIPIDIEILDETTDAYRIRDYSYYPRKVTIEGPELEVDALESIVIPVEINDGLGAFSLSKSLDLSDNIVVLNGTTDINVYGEVEPIITQEFYFSKSDIEISNLNENYEIAYNQPEEIIILTAIGPKSQVEAVSRDDIGLLIDASDFENGENLGTIFVEIKEGIIDYELSKEEVSIIVNIPEIESDTEGE